MKDYQINTEFLIGTAKDGRWTGVCLSSAGQSGVKSYGQVYAIISLSAPKEFNSKVAGDFLKETFIDVFYEQSKDISITGKLENAIMETAKKLEYLLQREKVASEKGIDLNMVCLSIKDEFVYLSQLGEGAIMLLRNGKLIKLTDGLKDLTGRDLIKSGSGVIKIDDIFVLLSEAATLEVNEMRLRDFMSRFKVSHESARSLPLFGLCLLKIQEQKEDDSEAIVGDEKEFGDEKDYQEEKEDFEDQNSYGNDDSEEDDLEDEMEPEVIGAGNHENLKEDSLVDEELAGFETEQESISPKGALIKNKLSQIRSSNVGQKASKIASNVKGRIQDKKTYEVIIQKIREFAGKLFRLFKKYIWEGLLGLKEGGMFIKGGKGKRPIRGIIIIIIIILILLYLSVKAVNKRSEHNEDVGQVNEGLENVDSEIDKARQLGAAGNLSEATKLFDEITTKLQGLKDYNVEIEKIDSKLSQLNGVRDEVLKVIQVSDSNVITNIAGFIENGSANDIVLIGDTIYMVDENNAAIYKVGIEGGEVQVVASNSSYLKQPKYIVFDEAQDLIIYDAQVGLVKVYTSDGTVEPIAGLSQTTVGNASALEIYKASEDSNTIYLLRPENNIVTKIVRYASGYGSPAERLSDPMLSNGLDMEIDGKIYVLSSSDVILRYYGTTLDPYTLVGLDKDIESPSALELDGTMVFLGDSAAQRIVVVLKGTNLAPQQGKFVSQIGYRGEKDGFKNIKEIIVDDKARKMYVLDGTNIYKVEIMKVDEYAQAVQ